MGCRGLNCGALSGREVELLSQGASSVILSSAQVWDQVDQDHLHQMATHQAQLAPYTAAMRVMKDLASSYPHLPSGREQRIH